MSNGTSNFKIGHTEILDFWFGSDLDDAASLRETSKRWFEKNIEFDDEIRARFAELPNAARNGQLTDWPTSDEGLLATILVLDQFPRNLYRNTANAFAYDAKALEHALTALDRELTQRLHPLQSVFIFMPLEHSENLEMQYRCVSGMEALAAQCPPEWRDKVAGFLRYAIAHQEVIEQFGRFPHRNEILGRESTEAELEFLASGRGSF